MLIRGVEGEGPHGRCRHFLDYAEYSCRMPYSLHFTYPGFLVFETAEVLVWISLVVEALLIP